MQFDCGITSADPWRDQRFLNLLRRWRGRPLSEDQQRELVILAHTPGVPLEWLYGVFRWSHQRRAQVNAMIDGVDYSKLGRANSWTVAAGDGFKMIVAALPCAGAAPWATQIELSVDPRSDAAIGRALCADRQVVRRWRTNLTFCPLTGVRVVPPRGVRIPS
jgi:hypothetical protein